MPIGTIVNGSYITITPTTIGSLPSSYNITPSPTMLVRSVDMQNLTLAMASADKFLDTVKLDLAGGTMTGTLVADDIVVPDGHFIEVQAGGSITGLPQTGAPVAALIDWQGTIKLDGDQAQIITAGAAVLNMGAGSKSSLLGRSVLSPARVAIADANKKISVATGTGIDYAGKRFTLPGNGAGTAVKRTITVDSTVNVPDAGETLTLICNNATNTVDGSGVAYEFVRDDATTIAVVYWQYSDVDAAHGVGGFWLTLEYVSGAWTLAENSGILAFDPGGGSWKYVGVQRV